MNLEETAKVLDVLTEQLSDLIGSQDRKLKRLVGEREELCEEGKPEKEYYGVLGGIEYQLKGISTQVNRLEVLNRGLEQALFQQEVDVYATTSDTEKSTSVNSYLYK